MKFRLATSAMARLSHNITAALLLASCSGFTVAATTSHLATVVTTVAVASDPAANDAREAPKKLLRAISKHIRNWELDKAGPKLDKALLDYPNSANIALLHGKFYYLSTPRLFSKAISEFDRAISLGLNDPEVYFYRASAKAQPTESYLARKNPDYAGAVDDFKHAQQLGSERDLRLQIVGALFDEGNYDEALTAANDYLKHHPQISLIPDMRMLKGKVLAELGRHEEALLSYKKAAKRYSYLDTLYYYRAVSLRALGKTKEAQAAINTGLSKKGRHQRELLYVRATVHYDLQQYSAAYGDYAVLWRNFNDWALPLLGCYNSLMQTDMGQQAGQYLDMAMQLDPQVVLHFNQQDLLKL